MHNVWLIARREYLERVRAKSFVVMTILIPLVLGGLVWGSTLMNRNTGATAHIAVVTTDAQFGDDLKQDMEGGRGATSKVDVMAPGPETRSVLDGEIRNHKLDGYVWVTPAAQTGARPTFEWVTKAKADIMTRSVVANAIRSALTREGLTRSGLSPGQVSAIFQPVELTGAGAEKSSGYAQYASVVAIFLLMYFAILFYGMNVARSIIEEKTSRVFEVMLATITPAEMMAGKVIGVGSVGLMQVGIWIIAGVLVLKGGVLALGFAFPITALQVFFMVLFFVLGFALYSAVAAALGAMNNSEQELQQMQMLMMLPLIICSFVLLKAITDSDGLIATVFSLIPFCTPLIMYVRIAVHQPPAWQILLSVFDLLLTILVVLWFASRIYRVGILMYGKKPNFGEIMRWLKYS
jgi:ABC-2 type transport system permease protein